MVAPSSLACQRSHFEIPSEVCYLDAAAWSPLPRSAREAGEAGIRAKSRPWAHPRTDFALHTEQARAGAAALVGARPDDIAIVGSISHAMATAALNLAPPKGGRILRIADEFPSLCLPFDLLAARCGLTVDTVARPADGDWTSAILAAVTRPGAPPLAVATLTPSHWTDGTAIDLDRIAPAVREAGAALVIDATQAAGATPVDVRRWKPDFLAFPTYKWALGPYGLAFLYVAPARQDGRPLEENAANRAAPAGARRFDRGELNDPVALPMAAAGLDLIAQWGPAAIAERLATLTGRLARGCEALGLAVPPASLRVPHVLGVRRAAGWSGDVIARLAARQVHVSERSGALRISPHVWADEDDVDLCLAALSDVLAETLR